MQDIDIDSVKIGKLLALHDESICIRAALSTRMSGIITGDLSLELDGRGSSTTFDRIVEQVLVPLCYEVALHMAAIGIVPIKLIKANVLTRNDQARKRRFSELGSAKTEDRVPFIPHYTTYKCVLPWRVANQSRWVVRLHKNGVVENLFESIVDKEPIYAIKYV
jgi:hypothetical protein